MRDRLSDCAHVPRYNAAIGDQLFAVAIRQNVFTNTAYRLSRAFGSVNWRGFGVFGETARQFHELSIGFPLFYFAVEFILGLFGWKYLYDDRKVFASSLLLSGVASLDGRLH